MIYLDPPSDAIDSISSEGNTNCTIQMRQKEMVCVCVIHSLTQENVENFFNVSLANDAAKPPLRVVGSDLNFSPIFHIVGKGSHGDWC